MERFCRIGHLARSGKRLLALLMCVCLIGTAIPITARAENGSTGTGLCEHHTEHTTECGYVAPTEGHVCEHEHDDTCGYAEASACTHVHTEECGEEGENCTHEHDESCGYCDGHECEHVHDGECGYVEASEGSPCTFVCEICEVQELTDELPDAEDITEENCDEVSDWHGEIDTAKEALEANAENTITFKALDGTAGANNAENFDKLVDGKKTSTKWCVTSFSSAYIVFKASERIYVDGYTITTGNDNSNNTERNPKDWTLKGCNDYDEVNKTGGDWKNIHAVTDDEVLEDKDYADYDFSFTQTTTAYQYFKLEITATKGDSCMQMSEFTLSYIPCNHVWGEDITRTIDPTCTEGGYDVYTCSKCGSEKNVPNGTPVTGHDRGEDGKCKNCGTYMISNVAELKGFEEAVNGGDTSANAILTADITVNTNLLSSLEYDDYGNVTNGASFTDWTPIGNSNTPYTGTFDGQGHAISGLYFNDKGRNYAGLFGGVGVGGSVSNVGVVDSYFQGNYCVGGVCGYNNGTIESCYSTGAFNGNYSVGGVCGRNNSGTIENCYNTGTVSGREDVGGLCGENYGAIENCYSTGAVDGSYNVGGLCGYTYTGTVTNCYYLSKTAGSAAKTAAQFKSGEVAYLLAQGCENGGSIWGQTIGTDDYPVLKGDTVYATTGCVTYNNSGDTSEKGHHYEKGICTDCGKYTEPENKDGVYQISKVTELYWLADTVKSGNGSINAVLTNDITVNSDLLRSLEYDTYGNVTNGTNFTSWTPIGYYNSYSDYSPYTGTFDGQGHIISGLYLNDTDVSYVGLFGEVGEGGRVLNVGVVDSYFQGSYCVGGLCGDNVGTIKGCYAICAVQGSEYVGGVCGHNDGTIINCCSDNSVPGGKVAIGYNYDGNYTNVSSKSTAQFASGEVAYLLNGSTSEGNLVWGQTLGGKGADAYPKAHTDTNTVYATMGCVTYNNSGDTSEKGHHYEKGICTDCGKHTEPENKDGVYQISNVTELYWLADTVNSGNGSINAVLTDDITVNSDLLRSLEYDDDGNVTNGTSFTDWKPIGYYNSDGDYSYYTGTFDGQGHTISGLYFNDTDANDVGLFGDVGESGSVLNVGVVDSYFSGSNTVGGLCGYSEGTITNCYNSGTVSGNGWYVGGVCGGNVGTVTNCYNSGTVSGDGYVGGVCGENYYGGTVTNCYNSGTASGDGYVGGVCGYSEGTITNCYNTGSVSGSGGYVGGVCGTNEGEITSCHNTGTVSGNGWYVGGVCGTNEDAITSCHNTGTVSGNANVGGVCGTNYSDSTITNCYNMGTVSGDDRGVGGVCGWNYNSGTIKGCYNTGSVSGNSAVGDVCGFNYGTITNCYYLAESEKDDIDGTTYKTTDDFQNGTVCGLVGYHSHQNGICIHCGGYMAAEYNDESECYEIRSAGQLYWFAGLVNGNPDVCDYDAENAPDGTQQNPSAKAVLTADIMVNSDLLSSLEFDDNGSVTNGDDFTDWTPIGDSNSPYTGTFDGQGHTISGLYFNDTNEDYVGLFGYVGTDGKISDISVADSYFKGKKYVGGVCGYNEGIIGNCYSTAAVNGIENAGGVCGANEGGTIGYEKTFGDAAFNLGVTNTNTDADMQYSVSGSKDAAGIAVADDKVITVDAEGNVTITGAGSATITVSLPQSTNHNAAESMTITVTVAKAENAPNMPEETMNVAYRNEKVSDVALPEDWVWQDADKDKELTAGMPVTATAVYDGSDKGNYVNETVSVSITRETISDGLWIEEISDQTYNGKAIKPEVQVYYDRQLLTAGKDYTISYKNNTNAATKDAVSAKGKSIAPTVTVKGKGNFSGTVTKTFTILPINLDNYETDAQLQEILTIEPVYAKYTGKVIKTAPTVKLNGKKLALSEKQYTCEYNDEALSAEQTAYKDCGIYNITIVGSGKNFVGKTTVTETISGELITKATITLDRSSYPYNKETGETFPSSVTVKDGKYTLTEGTDYTVSYKNYDKIGTATVIITGIGNYSGVNTKNYKITGTKLTKGMIKQLTKSFEYDGTEYSVVKNTDYTIADGENMLIEGEDYRITYKGDRRKAGTFKVIFSGIGCYSGSITKEFTIRKASVSTFDVTLPGSDSVIYTKGGTKPEPEVRFNGELLTEGTDYTVTYKNNTKAASAADKKAPYLYITGKGNFTGSTKAEPLKFTIVQASLDAQTIVIDNVPYKDKNNNFVPTITIMDSTTGKKLEKKTDYLNSFAYEIWDKDTESFVPFNEKKVEASEGNIRMRVTITGSGNYTGTASAEYEICRKSITTVKVAKIPDQEYTGKAITPKLTITDNGNELIEGTDYTLEYSNNTKKGTATVTIRGKGQYGGSRTVKFKITSRIFK